MHTSGAAVRRPGSDALGRYLLGREIGRGGMGCVYEATHCALEKRVAIKRFHPHLAANADSRARFVGEGRAIAQVRHPHVVEVFDLDENEEGGAPYLVMELLEGCTLAEHIDRAVVLSLPEAVDLALPLVSALSAAHAAGIVHRDVKPSNVFLRRSLLTDPCIVDFGVSKHASHVAVEELTQSGTLVGTYPYFSPEHTRGAKSVTAQSDQYSLAAVLYECVTGTRPFKGDSAYELMHAIATRDVEPPSRVRPALPREFDDILLRAMHRDPMHRYPTMQAFGSALLGFASRRSWHVWSTEFAAVSTDRGSLERTTDEKLPAAPPKPRRRVHPVLLVPVVLGIAQVAQLGLTASAVVHPAPAVTYVAPPAPTPRLPPAEPREPAATVVTPPAEPSATPVSAPAPVVEPVVRPGGRAAASAPRVHEPPATPPARAAPPAIAPAPSASAPHPPERGSNGVAIFD